MSNASPGRIGRRGGVASQRVKARAKRAAVRLLRACGRLISAGAQDTDPRIVSRAGRGWCW